MPGLPAAGVAGTFSTSPDSAAEALLQVGQLEEEPHVLQEDRLLHLLHEEVV